MTNHGAWALPVLLAACGSGQRPPADVTSAPPLTVVQEQDLARIMDLHQTLLDPQPITTAGAFSATMAQDIADKPAVEAQQQALLEARYDLSNRPAPDVTMSRGKPLQEGIRVKLPPGVTWDELSALTPAQIRDRGLFPKGFLPLPHVKQAAGGMVLPKSTLTEIQKQTGRVLTRFDVDHDIPEYFLPEFPPAIYLTSRPDLGDVSNGEMLTSQNFYRLFTDILAPKELVGLQFLVTPLPQQEFNLTFDRKVADPVLGVACLDCHVNGHTDGAFELAEQERPQDHRIRIKTPTMRGADIQRMFGSQRAIPSVENFTEFEEATAYFDGDVARAALKGERELDRLTEVEPAAEFQKLLDFPPAPKLGLDGKLVASLASPAELRGQDVFFGKAQCASCHAPPYYTDNTMHDLHDERFFQPQDVNGLYATATGPVKTFPLRGIKDSPPYLHDGRLLTLEDSVEYFNLIDQTALTAAEKQDLVAFLRVL